LRRHSTSRKSQEKSIKTIHEDRRPAPKKLPLLPTEKKSSVSDCQVITIPTTVDAVKPKSAKASDKGKEKEGEKTPEAEGLVFPEEMRGELCNMLRFYLASLDRKKIRYKKKRIAAGM
jgi:hypothetical protein